MASPALCVFCEHLSVGLHHRCVELCSVVLWPLTGRQVEHLLQFCLWAKEVRTMVRTELEDIGQTKAGVREQAVLFDE